MGGEDRNQATMFPERLDDYVVEDAPVRVIDVFIDDLDISGLGFKTQANDTGRPSYHPTTAVSGPLIHSVSVVSLYCRGQSTPEEGRTARAPAKWLLGCLTRRRYHKKQGKTENNRYISSYRISRNFGS